MVCSSSPIWALESGSKAMWTPRNGKQSKGAWEAWGSLGPALGLQGFPTPEAPHGLLNTPHSCLTTVSGKAKVGRGHYQGDWIDASLTDCHNWQPSWAGSIIVMSQLWTIYILLYISSHPGLEKVDVRGGKSRLFTSCKAKNMRKRYQSAQLCCQEKVLGRLYRFSQCILQ